MRVRSFLTVMFVSCLLLNSGCKSKTTTTPDVSQGKTSSEEVGTQEASQGSAVAADEAEVVKAIRVNSKVTVQELDGHIVTLDLTDLTPEDATDLTDEFAWTAGLPSLKTLKATGPGINDAAVSKLKGHPTLADILFEERSDVSDEGIKVLAALPKLTEVSLKRSPITDEAFKHLSTSKTLRRIRASNTKISDVGVNYLSATPQLQILDVSDCVGISDGCAEAIGSLKKLRFLRLWGTSITDKLATQLAGLTEMTNLTLQSTHITDEGLKNLESMKGLKDLSLYQTTVTDECLPTIGKLTKLQKLRLRETSVQGLKHADAFAELQELKDLDLSECPLDEGILKSIAKIKHLEALDLWNTFVSDKGIAELKDLKDLKELNLENNQQLTDASIDVIAGFTNLETLNLSGTQISDAGLPKLYSLKKLKALNLSHTSIGSKAFKELKAEMPGIKQLEY